MRQFKSSKSESRLFIAKDGGNLKISISVNGWQIAGVNITPDLFDELKKAIEDETK